MACIKWLNENQFGFKTMLEKEDDFLKWILFERNHLLHNYLVLGFILWYSE